MRRKACAGRLLTAALLLASAANAASVVSGVVRVRGGKRSVPLRKAAVVAFTADGRKVVAATRTDSAGRFRFPRPIAGRIALRVEKVGFLPAAKTRQGGAGRILDCRLAGSCESLAFEMIRAAVVAGTVIDELGEPFANVNAALRRLDGQGSRLLRTRTDDRGDFRIAGVAPGKYELTTASSYRGLDDSLYEGRPVELEVASGEVVDGLRVVLMRTGGGGFRVSGAVQGVELSSEVGNFVQFRPFGAAAPRSLQIGSLARAVNEDGTFAFDKIPEGRYLLTLQQARVKTAPEEQRRPERFMLGALEVAGDIEGLTLAPLPPTGIRGRIVYREASLGKPVLLALQGANGSFAQIFVEGAGGGEFSNLQILPDRYTIRSFGREHFVQAVLEDDEPLADNAVDVELGQVRDLRILLSRDFAQVSGRVKKPDSGAPAAFYRVALRGPQGVASVQADQYAHFRFEKVAPGGYEICAWPDAGLPQVKNGGIWLEAGGAVRAFPVDAGSSIEISLTAAR